MNRERKNERDGGSKGTTADQFSNKLVQDRKKGVKTKPSMDSMGRPLTRKNWDGVAGKTCWD